MADQYEVSPLDQSIEEVRSTYTCDLCNYVTQWQNNLNRHRKKRHSSTLPVHHSTSSVQVSSDQGSKFVHSSSASTSSNSTLPVTSSSIVFQPVSKETPYICEHCGMKYRSRNGLRFHIRDKHTKQYRYYCDICGKGENRLWNFRGHIKSHHKELKEICKTCNKSYQYRSDLLEHEKVHHPDNIPTCQQEFPCTKCNASFRLKKNLEQHVRGTHGSRSYKCHVCQKSFKWRSSMQYHLKFVSHD